MTIALDENTLEEQIEYLVRHAWSTLELHALDNGRGWARSVTQDNRCPGCGPARSRSFMVTRCWPEFDWNHISRCPGIL